MTNVLLQGSRNEDQVKDKKLEAYQKVCMRCLPDKVLFPISAVRALDYLVLKAVIGHTGEETGLELPKQTRSGKTTPKVANRIKCIVELGQKFGCMPW